MKQKPLQILQKKSPEFVSALNDLIEQFVSKKKATHSVGIAMNPTDQDSLAVQIHIPKSKKHTGPREKILDSLLVTFTSI